MNDPSDNATSPRGNPWIDREIQKRIGWRDGDVVISVPPKSGTTWTMNIVYQLFTGGTAEFRDIYEEVPWIELLGYPGQPHQEVLERIDAMPTTRRRAFKTHSAPPNIPFIAQAAGRDVKYIVVFRNPEEALVSFRPFLEKFSDDWLDLWQHPRGAVSRPDFPSFYSQIIDPRGTQGAFFGTLAAWWPLRNERNVLLIHFSDMKRDHEGSIRKISDFLGIHPNEDQWSGIMEYTSFAWMKKHEDKFEAHTAGRIPILKSGAMMRKGEVGKARSDGMTDEISAHLRAVGNRICPDVAAVNWLYKGGGIP